MYVEREIMKAIRDAEAAYDWNIDYRLVDQQEVGREDSYEYALEIEGQYAEEEAVRFFTNYGRFYNVHSEYTERSFAEIFITING